MAEQRTVNERYEVYNKISKRKDESKRLAEKQEEMKKRKKVDDTKTEVSGVAGGETTESEFEKKEKEESKSKEAAANASSASASIGPNNSAKLSRKEIISSYTPRKNRWDYVPGETESISRGAGGETPTPGRWVDPTPIRGGETTTPRHMGGRSKWDEPPTSGNATPLIGSQKDPNLMTPTPEISGQKLQYLMLEKEIDEKNKPLSDEELNQLLPSQGYEVSYCSIFLLIIKNRYSI